MTLIDRIRSWRKPAPDPDDMAPTPVGEWTCPDCGVQVPVTATVRHVAVVQLDHSDLAAHQLTHERAES